LSLDGAATPMRTRAAPGEKYPVTICAAAVPAGTRTALIDGLPLPLPKERPSRILLIGDTGCRLKGSKVQACNSLSQWPFRLGADMAAFEQPDLVIHVGDYHYRETACPLGDYGCSGTPWGDNWDVWRADFFSPAESLLNAAPWIFVRGNHEECSRGGMGWARALSPELFDPARGKAGCLAHEPPFVADIGVARVIDMDVAAATEEVENPEQVADYGRQLALAKDVRGPVWVAMHRPAFAEDAPEKMGNRGDNKTLAAALRANVASQMELVLSGHHHTFEAMDYGPDLPAQIVSGEGGDSLSPFAPREVKGLAINGVTVAAGVGRPGVFGFAMLERAPDDATGLNWTLTAFDTRGTAIARCMIKGRSLECE
jgi:predicted phosphodiesterase